MSGRRQRRKKERPPLTTEEFANLGGGQLAYVRAMLSEEASRIFPTMPPIQPGLQLYALLAANGSPILVCDCMHTAFAEAAEHHLRVSFVH